MDVVTPTGGGSHLARGVEWRETDQRQLNPPSTNLHPPGNSVKPGKSLTKLASYQVHLPTVSIIRRPSTSATLSRQPILKAGRLLPLAVCRLLHRSRRHRPQPLQPHYDGSPTTPCSPYSGWSNANGLPAIIDPSHHRPQPSSTMDVCHCSAIIVARCRRRCPVHSC